MTGMSFGMRNEDEMICGMNDEWERNDRQQCDDEQDYDKKGIAASCHTSGDVILISNDNIHILCNVVFGPAI